MNGGVAILLERMKTHPEEFFNHGSRWNNLIMDFERSLDPAEYKLLEEGIAKCRQEEFTQKVMSKLIGEEREDKETLSRVTLSNTTGAYNTGLGGVALLNSGAVTGTISNGGTWGTTSVSTIGDQLRAYNAQLEAQYDLVKAQKDLAKKEKKHKTIFGKLFNYT